MVLTIWGYQCPHQPQTVNSLNFTPAFAAARIRWVVNLSLPPAKVQVVRQDYTHFHPPCCWRFVRNTLVPICQGTGGSSGILSFTPAKMQVVRQDYSHFHQSRCRWLIRTTLISTCQGAGGSSGLLSLPPSKLQVVQQDFALPTCQGSGLS